MLRKFIMNEPAVLIFKFNAQYRRNNFNGPTSFLDGLIRLGNPLHTYCQSRYDAPHGRIFYTEYPVGDDPRDVYIKGVISFANKTFDQKTHITPDAKITDLISASWFAMNGTHMTMLEAVVGPVKVADLLGDEHEVRHF